MLINVKKGLEIPLAGKPSTKVEAGVASSVAVKGCDYFGMKPSFLVADGDVVKVGQPLFYDKRRPDIIFTSPAGGVVRGIFRGEKRSFKSVVIDISNNEEFEQFPVMSSQEINEATKDKISEILKQSGQWTAIKERPFGTIANSEHSPSSIFVTAMDTDPTPISVYLAIENKNDLLQAGLSALSRLTSGKVFFCKSPELDLPILNLQNLKVVNFSGKHPAGLVGTHINYLDPISPGKHVWYLDVQDVIAIGSLLLKGTLMVDRVIALGGPESKNPIHLQTRLGASILDLLKGRVMLEGNRVISGSVLSGNSFAKSEQEHMAFLGRYHNRIVVLKEGGHREFLGWLNPGLKKFSNLGVYLSSWLGVSDLAMDTSTHGSERAMVPLGNYENVVPLDILATQLLRAICIGDIESAEKLGVLELEEEDLALCTFICHSKHDFGYMLRAMLQEIYTQEQESE